MFIFTVHHQSMPQKSIAFLFFIPFLLFSFAWEQVKISPNVSVAFPKKPEKKIIEGKEIWIAELDSTVKMFVVITDFEKQGVDAKKMAELLKKAKTYTDLKNGFVLGAGNAVALKDSICTFKGKPAYYLKMDMRGEKEDLNKSQLMNVFVGAKMYGLWFLEKNGTSHEAEKLKFWNSLSIK